MATYHFYRRLKVEIRPWQRHQQPETNAGCWSLAFRVPIQLSESRYEIGADDGGAFSMWREPPRHIRPGVLTPFDVRSPTLAHCVRSNARSVHHSTPRLSRAWRASRCHLRHSAQRFGALRAFDR
jgi:hypothetical protein